MNTYIFQGLFVQHICRSNEAQLRIIAEIVQFLKLNYGTYVGENYKIQSICQNTSIHRCRSRYFISRFSIVVDLKCRGLRPQPLATDKVWRSKT